MRHPIRNLVWILVILAIAVYFIIPPDQRLRLGKDLRGGVSLTYAVQIAPGEKAEDVMDRLIDTLKRRVDPDGLLEITMFRQGRDRLVITMPLPNDHVKGLRAAYDAELDALDAKAFSSADFEQVMAAGDARAERLERLSHGDMGMLELLGQGASAYDRAVQLRQDLQDAEAAEAPDDVLDELAKQAAEAESAYDGAREAVFRDVLSGEQVRQALEKSNAKTVLFDQETKQAVELDSPRQRSIESLRQRVPGAADALDRALAAWNEYESNRTSLDDPSDLKRMLRGAGVLDFRITVDPGSHAEEARLRQELQEKGPNNVRAADAAWYRINRIENWTQNVQAFEALQTAPAEFFRGRSYVVEQYHGDGQFYMLCWDTRGMRLTAAEGQWSVAGAFPGQDDIGRPAINFRMDARGARLLGQLTENHVNDNMAILLDDEVYTAPNLNSRIANSGQIMGDFPPEELTYIIRVLSAGSLTAKLSPEPLSESTLGPELGADNLRAGRTAGLIALVIVSAFMIVYYFLSGVIAVVALLCNALLLLAIMSMNAAAFSLPGIAGIILTFGMAVDANVLIYERMREEIRAGADTRKAVRLGYQKALSSIVDGNVTNLIVCVVLGRFGTQEIKGFAITLGIGVLTTLFSALIISRILVALCTEVMGIRKLSMLALVMPVIDRVLEPRFDWMRARWFCRVLSTGYVALGIGMIAWQGEHMLDNEFRGGVELTLPFQDAQGRPVIMTRVDVQAKIMEIAEAAPPDSLVQQLRAAEVLPVNPESDGVSSSLFKIKTTIADAQTVLDAVLPEFASEMAVKPAIDFEGQEASPGSRDMTAFPIIEGTLGANIERPTYLMDVTDYLGGVAIVLDQLDPRPSLEDLVGKVKHMREQADYSDTLTRTWQIVVLEGDESSVASAAVLVLDPSVTVLQNEERWRNDVQTREWTLVTDALSRSTTLASVQSFTASIASTFKTQAIVAVFLSFMLITIYIWVRFGSVRYSMAALIALLHDVLTVIGFVALAEIIYDSTALGGVARSLGIMPFKIDLNMIAAILTIAGYSLNDTIIIMDRIRENKGKLDYAPRNVINESINQTVSRTVITSGTTLLSVVVLYAFGGEGVRAFAYALLIGILVGTYSSIAVAAPIVWSSKHDRSLPATSPAPAAA